MSNTFNVKDWGPGDIAVINTQTVQSVGYVNAVCLQVVLCTGFISRHSHSKTCVLMYY